MVCRVIKSVIFTLLALWGSVAQASFVINGDFELNSVKPGGWSWFYASDVPGWSGSNIEIWNSMDGVQAQSGQHFIELNAHGHNKGLWSIFQTFNTEIGKDYELNFFYRARTYSQESFKVSVANLNATLSDHDPLGWLQFTARFTANSDWSTLRFTSLNPGTYGNFIDNVSVITYVPSIDTPPGNIVLPSDVYAPAGLGVLFMVFAGLLFRRKKS